MSNKYLTVGLVVVAIIAILGCFTPEVKQAFGTAAPSGTISYSTAIASQYGYYVGVYNTAVQIIDDSGSFVAGLVAKAGVTYSYTNSTSTVSTTQTLAAADIINYTSVIFTPNTGATTLTLPASSTLSTFLPNAGDWMQQCWYNATSTLAATTTFAAGVGFDIEVASSTGKSAQGVLSTNLSIGPGNSGCFRFIRKPATATAFDFVAQFTSFTDAD